MTGALTGTTFGYYVSISLAWVRGIYFFAEHLDFGLGERFAGEDLLNLSVDIAVLRLILHQINKLSSPKHLNLSSREITYPNPNPNPHPQYEYKWRKASWVEDEDVPCCGSGLSLKMRASGY
jgi:hypothetical protein